MTKYTDFEDRVTTILAHDWDLTRGDAQGLVEAKSEELLEEYVKGTHPEDVVKNLWVG